MKTQPSSGSVPGAAHVPTSREVESYLGLVNDIARRYARKVPPSVLRVDLVAAGATGVFDALRRHGSERGPAFEGYVRTRIRGAIVDELRSQDWLSRERRKLANARTESGPGEAAAYVVAIEDLPEETQNALTDSGAVSPMDELATQRDRKTLADAVAALPPRERVVITLHYLQDVQLATVAATLGVSIPRASQLRARAIATLRTSLSPDALEHGPERMTAPAPEPLPAHLPAHLPAEPPTFAPRPILSTVRISSRHPARGASA